MLPTSSSGSLQSATMSFERLSTALSLQVENLDRAELLRESRDRLAALKTGIGASDPICWSSFLPRQV